MRTNRLTFCRRIVGLVPTVLTVLIFLTSDHLQARIGEGREAMIQRLGPPKYQGDSYCGFTLDDVHLSARFYNGNCFEEEYRISGIKAKNKERIDRINLILKEASGGVSWDIVNLSGEGVEWQTEDRKLKAVLASIEEEVGSRDDPETRNSEYLTVKSVEVERLLADGRKKTAEKEMMEFPYQWLRYLILIIAGAIAFRFWVNGRRTISCAIGLLMVSANPWVPIGQIGMVFGVLAGGLVAIFLVLWILRWFLLKLGKL